MRNKKASKEFYVDKLGFTEISDYGDYLMMMMGNIEIHFFEFKELDPKENYGQVYIRTNNIHEVYQKLVNDKVNIHPDGSLQVKPWGQIEFSLLDPDNNLLTFGQRVKNLI